MGKPGGGQGRGDQASGPQDLGAAADARVGGLHRLARVVEPDQAPPASPRFAARRLSSPQTTVHGATGLWVRWNVSRDRLGEVVPAREALHVGLAELPLLQRVALALEEPAQLLGPADRDPELDEADPVAARASPRTRGPAGRSDRARRRCSSRRRARPRRGCTRSGRRAPSRPRSAGARRSAGSTIGRARCPRARQRDDAGVAGFSCSVSRLDRATLAGGVAALEDHHDPPAGGAHPALHLDQLELAGLGGTLVGLCPGSGRGRGMPGSRIASRLACLPPPRRISSGRLLAQETA